METTSKAPRHIGRRIGRIREMLGVKQETLAEQMGITQQAVSKLEQSEELEENTLERVAKALGVPAEAIKNFNDESVFNIISNTFSDFKDHAVASALNYHCSFNPFDEIRKLNQDKEELYKSLLKEKDEKIALLEQLVKGK